MPSHHPTPPHRQAPPPRPGTRARRGPDRTAARRRRAVAVLACALVVWLGGTPAALAHSRLLDADPGADDVAAVGTTRVRLHFQDLDTSGTQEVRVLPRGADGGDRVVAVATQGFDTLLVTTSPLAAGSYELTYTITPADGHRVKGAYTLSVGGAASEGMSTTTVGGAAIVAVLLAGVAVAVLRTRRAAPGAPEPSGPTPSGPSEGAPPLTP